MASLHFAVTYDYRCPFARIAHDHVTTGLLGGADWQVTFLPFSLSQVHVEEGEPAVWDDPARRSDLLALAASVVVRDRFPEVFVHVHRALFAARHDHGGDVRERTVVAKAVGDGGADPEAVLAEVDAGWPFEVVRQEHELAVADHHVFGVPTFVAGGQAAFVRLLERPGPDGAGAVATVEQVVRLVRDQPVINEVKHTTVPF